MRVLVLESAASFAALREQLLERRAERTLILVQPEEAGLPALFLVLLQRLAQRERLEVAIVSDARDVRRQAKALGLPAFREIRSAERQGPSWRQPRIREAVGLEGRSLAEGGR